MIVFKNTELAEKYKVSLGTVRNWIEATQAGKLELDLKNDGERLYVINNIKNLSILDGIVEERRKFRNTRAVKKVKPTKEFYEFFNEEQCYDIASSLEIHREIPLQYTYFDGGAESWDQYITRLSESKSEKNSFYATRKLLDRSRSYIDSLLADYDKVNLFDIGQGNSMPARWFIDYLLENKKLGRYMAYDLSHDLLQIAESNIKNWYKNKVKFEGYVRNINSDRFSDILMPEYVGESSKKTANIILHLGYTLRNMRNPENGYRTIYDSMGTHDFLFEDDLLDTDHSRNYFDFEYDESTGSSNSLVPNLLNIDPTYYQVEIGFDKELHQRFEKIRFNVVVDIEFEFENGTRIVEINKGDAILLWRNKHNSVDNILKRKKDTGFSLMYLCKSDDLEYMLTISRVRKAKI